MQTNHEDSCHCIVYALHNSYFPKHKTTMPLIHNYTEFITGFFYFIFFASNQELYINHNPFKTKQSNCGGAFHAQRED